MEDSTTSQFSLGEPNTEFFEEDETVEEIKKFLNEGEQGATAEPLRLNAFQLSIIIQAAGVLLHMGTNNLTRWNFLWSEDTLQQAIQAAARELSQHPAVVS